MKIRNNRERGFTLVELLVVISIIILIMGALLPSFLSFMKHRRLNAATQMLQMTCMQARSFAISQREKHVVVFYVNNSQGNAFAIGDLPAGFTNLTNKSGARNTFYIYDSNENTLDPNDDFAQVGTSDEMPEFTTLKTPNQTSGKNFGIVFLPNGSATLLNMGSDQLPNLETETNLTKFDIVIEQDDSPFKSVIDVVTNTGQILFALRNDL